MQAQDNEFSVARSALRDVLADTAKDVWDALDNLDGGSHLIFPDTRDGKPRLGSEQEARFLLCHRLELSTLFYAVEAPSHYLYSHSAGVDRQEADGTGTARIDVAVYTRRDPASRLANVELKAGVPDHPEAEWDLLKLVREHKDGVWIVAMPQDLSAARFAGFLRDVCAGLEGVAGAHKLRDAEHLTIVLIFTHRRIAICASVEGASDWAFKAQSLFEPSAFTNRARPGGDWSVLAAQDASESPLFRGSLSADVAARAERTLDAASLSFIFAPAIEPGSWLLMSTDQRGGVTRYALRAFGMGVRKEETLKPRGLSSIQDFRLKYVAIELPCGNPGDRVPPIKQEQYWRDAIAQLNVERPVSELAP